MCFLPTDCLVTGAVWGSLGMGAGTGTVCRQMLTDCTAVRYSEYLGTAFDSVSYVACKQSKVICYKSSYNFCWSYVYFRFNFVWGFSDFKKMSVSYIYI